MGTFASNHAVVRQQQRGIPSFVIESLIDYGKVNFDHHGGEIFTFPKAIRQKLHEILPKSKYLALESHFDCYAVLSDGVIVTVGHRTKKMKR